MPLVDSTFNINQEKHLRKHITRLEQTLIQEALQSRIAFQIHQSFSEEEILQTAIRELVKRLNIQGCSANQYHPNSQAITTHSQYSTSSNIKQLGHLDRVPAINRSTEFNRAIQFCSVALVESFPTQYSYSVVLACPLLWEKQLLGELWLYKPQHTIFETWEIRLVEQVAKQIAIALHKAQCYQIAQQKIEELQKLSEKKDDFLQIVAHEVRAPMTNMLMALNLLEASFKNARSSCQVQFDQTLSDLANLRRQTPCAEQSLPCNQTLSYLEILKNECRRELVLINDLLDLQQLDFDADALPMANVAVKPWLSQLVEPFKHRVRSRQQSLQVNIADDLPAVVTHLDSLTRVIQEILNNACKYTPTGDCIIVSAQVIDRAVATCASRECSSPFLQLRVTNTGNPIPPEALPRLFEKFYRVPGGDPGKQGGTGLGLAVVKKLVMMLGGVLWVKSDPDGTYFVVELPLQGLQ